MLSGRTTPLSQRSGIPAARPAPEPLLRTLLGDALRRERQRQRRTLRDVSAVARVSLGYLSEIERGQKEPSSELLAAICTALRLRVLDVLETVLAVGVGRTDELPVRLEPVPSVVSAPVAEPLPIRPTTGAPTLVNRAA